MSPLLPAFLTAAGLNAFATPICDRPIPSGISQEQMQALTRAYGEFGFGLYRKARLDGQNLVLSPLGVATTLAMTTAGARGETAREIRATLKVGPLGDRLHELNAYLLQDLDCREDRAYQFASVRGLWAQESLWFRSSFIGTLDHSYATPLGVIDFKVSGEQPRARINDWIKNRTKGKVAQLITPGSLPATTELVLTQVAFYTGSWLVPFAPEATALRTFWVNGQQGTPAPAMTLRHSALPYAEWPRFQAVALPILAQEQTNEVDQEFVLLLPKSRGGLADLEAKLGAGLLQQILARLAPRDVSLSMPRFKVAAPVPLVKTLRALGLRSAFDPVKADFTGMVDGESVRVDQARHQAVIEVDERGLEGAGATTAAAMGPASMPNAAPPVTVVADHPFVFLVIDKATRAVLLMGRVVDPGK